MGKTRFGELVEAQGRQQKWVAEHIGVDQGTVSRWVWGNLPISPKRRTQLASLLGVDEAEITGEVKA